MMFLSPEDPDVDCDTELARMLKACEEARTSNRELLLLSKRIEAQTADLMALDEEEDSREKVADPDLDPLHRACKPDVHPRPRPRPRPTPPSLETSLWVRNAHRR